MKITLENPFHSTSVNVVLKNVSSRTLEKSETWEHDIVITTGTLSKRQWDKVWRVLCGISDCQCWSSEFCLGGPARHLCNHDGTVEISYYEEMV